MEVFKRDIKQIPMLFSGLFLLSLGIYLTKLSTLGMSSWNVFHDGVALHVPYMSFGVVTQVVGLIILVVSVVFLKTKVGLGTICNIIFVGIFIDFMEWLYPVMENVFYIQIIVLVFGILFTTFGRSMYIASRLGPGPRDGLFVGLARVTHIQVRYVKIAIEFIFLGIGILLGGQAGLGTAIIIVVSGYLVQFFFKVLHFDPKTVRQNNVLDYFN